MKVETERLVIREFTLADRNGHQDILGACASVVTYGFQALRAHQIFPGAIAPVKSVGLMQKPGMPLKEVQKRQSLDNDGNGREPSFCGLLRESWQG